MLSICTGAVVLVFRPSSLFGVWSPPPVHFNMYSHSPTPPLNGNQKVTVWCRHHHHRGEPLPDSCTCTYRRAIMPETFGVSTPPSLMTGARAQKPKARQSPETDAARRRARQGIRECELIWLLQQRLRAVSGTHWRLHCMQPMHGATATAWEFELSDLDHSHAAIPQRVTRASCAQLLRSVLGAACR